jgi:hypothetical protein
MKAILDIHGWRKVDEVPDGADFRGWVRIAICPPLDILFRHDEKVTDRNITTVELFYEGIVTGLPFFRSSLD